MEKSMELKELTDRTLAFTRGQKWSRIKPYVFIAISSYLFIREEPILKAIEMPSMMITR